MPMSRPDIYFSGMLLVPLKLFASVDMVWVSISYIAAGQSIYIFVWTWHTPFYSRNIYFKLVRVISF